MNLLRNGCAAAALLWGAPAFAGEAACLWNALAPASQDRLLAAHAAASPPRPSELEIEPAESRRQITRCAMLGGSVDARRAAEAMRLSLQGLVMRRSAADALAALGAHTEEHLDLAWRDLGPQRRARLRALAEARAEDQGRPAPLGPEAAGELGELFAALDRHSALPRQEPAVQTRLEIYALGRALQEAFEPRF